MRTTADRREKTQKHAAVVEALSPDLLLERKSLHALLGTGFKVGVRPDLEKVIACPYQLRGPDPFFALDVPPA